ncbi:MAG TPA: hypothetical protein VGW77_18455 [Candidatus Binatia bacterium]|jgi:hypothetical protein|nr:hypothetical protein [Candidatus Binatia bacterium]
MDGVLTKEQAEQLLLVRLGSAKEHHRISIQQDRTVERPFCWIFFFAIDDSSPGDEAQTKFPRQVIVNKYSTQIVASSIEHSPEDLIKIYEELLAQSQAHSEEWCLTVSAPNLWRKWWERRVRRKAADSGLYEIGGKETAP